MEDISTLIWIGIGVIWFLSRLVRRGAKKVAGAQKRQPRPQGSQPTTARTETPQVWIENQPGAASRDRQGPPPPIVPR